MKTIVLLNPEASGCDDPDEIEAEISAALPDARIERSRSEREGREAVRDALDAGCEMVVAAGGDGTVHGVLNAIGPDFDRAALAVLPLGTANDFARSFSLPLDLDDALEAVALGRTRTLDVIEIRADGADVRYCGNVTTGGFSGKVREDLDKEDKSRWGPLSYVRAGLEKLNDVDRWDVEIDIDPDGDSRPSAGPQRIVNVVVANGSRAGGNIPVAPDADPEDGLMDFLWVRDNSRTELGVLAAKMAAGRHMEDDRVEIDRVRSLRLRTDPVMPFTADGEPFSCDDVEFRVLPRALRLVTAVEE